MKKADFVKERIIRVTIDLIQESGGNINEVTTRLIAERAGVGVGLVNYHFISKDLLIEQCVQRIINDVIMTFRPDIQKDLSPIERLKTITKLVIEFLLDHPAVSRISILGDYQNPRIIDNTMKTVNGFVLLLKNSNISEKEKEMLLFSLTSILQVAFLRRDISKECFGIDFYNKEERDSFIDLLIDRFFLHE